MRGEADVVVVGAGIGGAVLALALGQRGWSVVAVEKEAAPRTIVRPEVLWGATPRLLDRIGVGDLVRGAAVRVRGVEIRRSGSGIRLLEISEDDFARAGVEGWSTDPTLTRSKLLEAALATGRVRVDHSVEIRELVREGSRIAGASGLQGDQHLEYRARLVVGDDGANSVVRGALGIPIATRLFPIDFVSALISWPRELEPDRARIWLNPSGFQSGLPAAGFIPWPRERGVMLVPLPRERVEALICGPAEHFWTELARVTPLASVLSGQIKFPSDFSRVRRPFGHAARYVADGAALIGDAVHPMTPAGGQGANASIADAMALAEVADGALRAGDVGAERLAEYERRRRGANQRSVEISVTVDRLFRAGGLVPGVERLIPIFLRVMGWLGLPSRGIRYFATAFQSDR